MVSSSRLLESPNQSALWLASLTADRVYLFFDEDLSHPDFGSWQPFMLVASHLEGKLIKFPLAIGSQVFSRAFGGVKFHDGRSYRLSGLPSQAHHNGEWEIGAPQSELKLINQTGGSNLTYSHGKWGWENAKISEADYQKFKLEPRAYLSLEGFVNQSTSLGYRLLFSVDHFSNLYQRPETSDLSEALTHGSSLDKLSSLIMLRELGERPYQRHVTPKRQDKIIIYPAERSQRSRQVVSGSSLLPSIIQGNNDFLLPSIGPGPNDFLLPSLGPD